MNKAMTVLAAGLLAFALAACADPPASRSAVTAEPAPVVDTTTYRACLLTDDAPLVEGGPAQQAITGLQRAEREIGVEIKHVAVAAPEYAAALQAMADDQCQIVIGLGSASTDAVEAAAKLNPDVHFALVDGVPNSAPPNLRPVFFSTHESSFLAGYFAASRSASGKVGVFGGLNIPAVTIYLDGFVQGVARYNQDNAAQVAVLGWDLSTQQGSFVRSASDPWSDPEAGRMAAAELTDQGADVVFAVARESGVGALQLAQQSGTMKVLWSDTDGCLTQPEYCGQLLGSVVKDRANAVYEVVRADHAGQSAAGVFVAGLRNGGTALVEARPGDLSPEITGALNRLAEEVVAGKTMISSPAAVG